MRRFSSRSARWWSTAVGVAVASGLSACGASPVGGPDPARSTYFRGTAIDASPIPYRFRKSGDLNDTYLIEARLVPLDLGRTTDTRIFDDRGGSGSGSGNGRDTTVSTGRMSDIRKFASNAAGTDVQTDSTVVDVVRVGDVLYITRPHPDPTRRVTDTAVYHEAGVLVRPLGYWRNVIEPSTGRQLYYSAIR